jgi:hypothetical protein
MSHRQEKNYKKYILTEEKYDEIFAVRQDIVDTVLQRTYRSQRNIAHRQSLRE